MSEKFSLGWDIDGVEADSGKAVADAINKYLGFNYFHPRNFNSWNYVGNELKAMLGDTEETARLVDHWFNPETLLKSPPYRGRLCIMNLCRFLGIDNQVITTRRPHTRQSTIDWFSRHLLWINSENRLHLRDDLNYDGNQYKIDQAKALKIHYLVEDSGETIEAFDRAGLSHLILMISQPWNKSFTQFNRLRVKNDLHLFGKILHGFLLHKFTDSFKN